MSGIKETRKKIQRTLNHIVEHENQEAAFHEMLLIARTCVVHLNQLAMKDPQYIGPQFRFTLLDLEEEHKRAEADKLRKATDHTKEDPTYGEQFRQALQESCPPEIEVNCVYLSPVAVESINRHL
jgi:hypothetical protein